MRPIDMAGLSCGLPLQWLDIVQRKHNLGQDTQDRVIDAPFSVRALQAAMDPDDFKHHSSSFFWCLVDQTSSLGCL